MALSLILSSCSGLKKQMLQSYFKKSEDLKAVSLNFKEPPAPYIKKQHDTLDGFWLNKEKASSISYFSSCSQVPRNLKAFQTSSYPSDLNYKVLKRVKKPDSFYSVLRIQKDSGLEGTRNKMRNKSRKLGNSKAKNSLSLESSQQKDNTKLRDSLERLDKSKAGHQSYIAVYSTKKKDCFFNLNLVAPSQKVFQEEEESFQSFIQNFKPL